MTKGCCVLPVSIQTTLPMVNLLDGNFWMYSCRRFSRCGNVIRSCKSSPVVMSPLEFVGDTRVPGPQENILPGTNRTDAKQVRPKALAKALTTSTLASANIVSKLGDIYRFRTT